MMVPPTPAQNSRLEANLNGAFIALPLDSATFGLPELLTPLFAPGGVRGDVNGTLSVVEVAGTLISQVTKNRRLAGDGDGFLFGGASVQLVLRFPGIMIEVIGSFCNRQVIG